MSNPVYLDITTYQGISIGAIHYYGKLMQRNDTGYTRIDLFHKITNYEAKRLTIKQGGMYKWEAGEETSGFESEIQLRKLAIKTYKVYFIGAKVLLLGNPSYIEPKLCLDGPAEFVQLSETIYAKCEKLGWYSYPENDKKMDKLYKQWKQALDKALEE